MNKFSFSLLALFLMSCASFAQQNRRGDAGPSITGKISGVVIDTISRLPVEFASVALYNMATGKLIDGAQTDEKGFFKLSNVRNGTYSLAVSFVGYQKKTIDSVVTTLEKPDRFIGKISLHSSTTEMKEVVIESEAATIENKVDRIVYNTEKDITSKGGDATDVLQKVPLLSVDMDGNVSMRGNSNVKVLINGKPSGILANNLSEALKAIPADQIKSVEVITNPSAKYDAEGTAGIINIITKKKSLEGLTGSVNGAVGNNRNNFNSNINARRDRLGITANIGGRLGVKREGSTNYLREDTYNTYTRTLTQSGKFVPRRGGVNASLGMDYDLNAYNSFTSSLSGDNFVFDRSNDILAHLQDTAEWFYTRSSVNPTTNKSFDWNSEYKKTFAKPQQELSVALMINRSLSNNHYSLEQTGNAAIFDTKEKSDNTAINKETAVQFDYTDPVAKYLTVESGVKGLWRNSTSDYTYNLFNPASSVFSEDTSRSRKTLYVRGVGSAYTVLSFKLFNKIDFKPGLRYEYTKDDGDFGHGALLNHYYGNVIPSFAIGRTFANLSSIKFSYSKRLQRPGSNYLNPFVNASDPKNISYGNPYLTAEIANSYELSFATYSKVASGNVSVYYKEVHNAIQSITDITPAGVSTTTFENIGKSQTIGMSFFGSLTLFKIWTTRGVITLYQLHQEGEYKSRNLSNTDIQYNANLNTSLRLPKNFSFELFGNINSPRSTLQGKTPSMSMMHLGLNKDLWKKKATVGLRVWQPFQKDLKFVTELNGANFHQESTNLVPFRSYGITFSYSFGKMEFKQPRKRSKDINSDDKKGEGGEF